MTKPSRIGVIHLEGDNFLDDRLAWLDQYGSVEIVRSSAKLDYDEYFDLVVLDGMESQTTGITELMLKQKFFQWFFTEFVHCKLLLMNFPGLSAFETIGGKTVPVEGHNSKSPYKIRRHGLITKTAPKKPFLYTSMPSYHSRGMVAESVSFGNFISYSSLTPKKVALKNPFEACEEGEIFLESQYGILVGLPYMTNNLKNSNNWKTLGLSKGCFPSDYVLRFLLNKPYEDATSDLIVSGS